MIPVQDVSITNIGGGGANEKLEAHLINDNQSARPDSSTLPLKNVHTNTIGKLIKRKGYTVYSSGQIVVGGVTFNKVFGILQYRKFSGTEYEIAIGSDGSTKKIANISTIASPADITGAVSITEDTKIDHATVADTLIITTEARDTPIKWTGTGNAAALGGSPPAGKYCEEFFNYAFIANTSSNPERVYWSALFNPESWTATDFKRLEDSCTGLARRGDDLFCFTRNSITVVKYTGDSLNPFTFDRVDSNVGCIANRTLKNLEGVLYWLAGDGHIYRMPSGSFKPERVTEAIPVTISELNGGALSIACAEDHRELRQYWCCVPKSSSTVCDFIIVVDYLSNEIFMYDGFNVNCIANFVDSSGVIKTYFGDRTGRIFLTNNGNSDYPSGTQTAIDFWKYTKQFNFGSPNKRKRLRRLKATVNNGGNYTSFVDTIGDFGATGGESLTLSHNGGGKLLGSTWVLGTDSLGRKSDIPAETDSGLTSSYMQFKFHNNAYEQAVEVRDLTLSVQVYDQDKKIA